MNEEITNTTSNVIEHLDLLRIFNDRIQEEVNIENKIDDVSILKKKIILKLLE